MHVHLSIIDQLHVGIALIITAAYLSIPFTSLRKLPMPKPAYIAGMLFFITCAITHLAIAMAFHDSPWMLLNDSIQAISTVVFITTVSRMVTAVLARQEQRRSKP